MSKKIIYYFNNFRRVIMSKKKLSILLIIMVFLVSVFSFSVQAESIVLRYSEQAADGPGSLAAFDNKFAELVEEKTEGRVKVDIYWSSSLTKESIEAVGTGIADFCQMGFGVLAEAYKPLSVFDAPFFWDNSEQVLKVSDPRSTIIETINKNLSPRGVRILTFYPIGFRHLTTTKKPIYSPDDLKGLKISLLAFGIIICNETSFFRSIHHIFLVFFR